MIEVNAQWESEATFSETHDSFSDIASGVSELLSAVEAAGDDSTYQSLAESLEDLSAAASDVILGLEAPDNGEARVEAMDDWVRAVDSVDALVHGLTPTSSSTSTPVSADTTRIDAATATTAFANSEDEPLAADSGGWIPLVLLAIGVAYFLGRRHGSNS
jgi:hypothetical protein